MKDVTLYSLIPFSAFGLLLLGMIVGIATITDYIARPGLAVGLMLTGIAVEIFWVKRKVKI